MQSQRPTLSGPSTSFNQTEVIRKLYERQRDRTDPYKPLRSLHVIDYGPAGHIDVLGVMGTTRNQDAPENINLGVYQWLKYVALYPSGDFQFDDTHGIFVRPQIVLRDGSHSRMEHAAPFLRLVADQPYILSFERANEEFVALSRGAWQMLCEVAESYDEYPIPAMPPFVQEWLTDRGSTFIKSTDVGLTYGLHLTYNKCGYAIDVL